jgi:hypothetical protein
MQTVNNIKIAPETAPGNKHVVAAVPAIKHAELQQ